MSLQKVNPLNSCCDSGAQADFAFFRLALVFDVDLKPLPSLVANLGLRLDIVLCWDFGGGEDPELEIARFEGIPRCNDARIMCDSLEFLRKLATRLSTLEVVPINDSIEYSFVKKALLSLRIFSDVLNESSVLSWLFILLLEAVTLSTFLFWVSE